MNVGKSESEMTGFEGAQARLGNGCRELVASRETQAKKKKKKKKTTQS